MLLRKSAKFGTTIHAVEVTINVVRYIYLLKLYQYLLSIKYIKHGGESNI
jgi:hypothetical protein